MSNEYYPALLNLGKKKCVVIGGGKVAERKTIPLVRCGARVFVISPVLTPGLARLKKAGAIRHTAREYRQGDLKGAFLVIAATANEPVNKAISREAPNLVNVVDVPELANFIVPAVVKRGPLTISVSTSGTSPAMAAAIKKEIALLYAGDFGKYLRFLGTLRKKIIRTVPDKKTRERLFQYAASAQMLNVLRTEGCGEARRKILDGIGRTLQKKKTRNRS